MDNAIKKITIIGGGTAGWLTAGIIAAEHQSNTDTGIQITLIESPDVKILGVGEGTWPTMRTSLQKMGISETDFIQACDASFKQGSKFVGWVNGNESDAYYHPFVLPQGFGKANLVPSWQQNSQQVTFADAVSVQSHLSAQNFAPKQQSTPEYAAVASYGYHLDAGKFAKLLQKHCTENLGVKYVSAHVVRVNSHPNGDIASVSTKTHGDITGDLFVDCSGSASLLLGKHYQIPFISKHQYLFNDTALAVQIPYVEENSPIASSTIATAQTAGWIWDIGLPSRRGVGHVYSSAHMQQSSAESLLRQYIAPSIGQAAAEQADIRKIAFTPGHREKFWHKNCVAVGMAAGFIEPLEASALAMVELSAKMISDELPASHNIMAITAKRFNERFNYNWDRIIDFLKLHYVLSQRRDSDYWRDNCREETMPERLQELLELWQYQVPSASDFNQGSEIFPAASYQYILYGMGFKTQARATSKSNECDAKASFYFQENSKMVDRFKDALPNNRQLINHIKQYGLPKS
ncbi:MAG: tryptophan 7-halogenase [Colwellia sp.]|nr:tryptophan 7-halogenase [Colwellia sp.]